jgi:hypothetical protein
VFFSHYPVIDENAALPFVIPTGAQRSGGICSSADTSWKCFSLSLQNTKGCPTPPISCEVQWFLPTLCAFP